MRLAPFHRLDVVRRRHAARGLEGRDAGRSGRMHGWPEFWLGFDGGLVGNRPGDFRIGHGSDRREERDEFDGVVGDPGRSAREKAFEERVEEVEGGGSGEVARVNLKPGRQNAAKPVGHDVSSSWRHATRSGNALHLSEATEERVRLESSRNELEPLDELAEDVGRSSEAAIDDQEQRHVLLVWKRATVSDEAEDGRGVHVPFPVTAANRNLSIMSSRPKWRSSALVLLERERSASMTKRKERRGHTIVQADQQAPTWPLPSTKEGRREPE